MFPPISRSQFWLDSKNAVSSTSHSTMLKWKGTETFTSAEFKTVQPAFYNIYPTDHGDSGKRNIKPNKTEQLSSMVVLYRGKSSFFRTPIYDIQYKRDPLVNQSTFVFSFWYTKHLTPFVKNIVSSTILTFPLSDPLNIFNLFTLTRTFMCPSAKEGSNAIDDMVDVVATSACHNF